MEIISSLPDIPFKYLVLSVIGIINVIGYVVVYRIKNSQLEYWKDKANISDSFIERRDEVLLAKFNKTVAETSKDYALKITEKSDELFQESYYENMRVVLELVWTSIPEDRWVEFLEAEVPTNKETYLGYLRRNPELLRSLFGDKLTHHE